MNQTDSWRTLFLIEITCESLRFPSSLCRIRRLLGPAWLVVVARNQREEWLVRHRQNVLKRKCENDSHLVKTG